MRDGHLQKRAGRDFVNNLAWMIALFGALGAVLGFATQLPLLGVAAFVGIFASAMAAIVTVGVLWSGAYEDTSPGGGHRYPGPPPVGGSGAWLGGRWHGGGGGAGGGWDGGGGGGDGGGGGAKAAFRAHRNGLQAFS
jgi:hypothetical protein